MTILASDFLLSSSQTTISSSPSSKCSQSTPRSRLLSITISTICQPLNKSCLCLHPRPTTVNFAVVVAFKATARPAPVSFPWPASDPPSTAKLSTSTTSSPSARRSCKMTQATRRRFSYAGLPTWRRGCSRKRSPIATIWCNWTRKMPVRIMWEGARMKSREELMNQYRTITECWNLILTMSMQPMRAVPAKINAATSPKPSKITRWLSKKTKSGQAHHLITAEDYVSATSTSFLKKGKIRREWSDKILSRRRVRWAQRRLAARQPRFRLKRTWTVKRSSHSTDKCKWACSRTKT